MGATRIAGLCSIPLGVAMGLIGDIALKSSSGLDRQFALGAIAYASAIVPVWFGYRVVTFAGMAVIWQLLNIAASLLLAVLVFHEHLTWNKAAAAGLALGALVLLAREP